MGRGKTYLFNQVGHKVMLRWSCGTQIVQKKKKSRGNAKTFKHVNDSKTVDDELTENDHTH